MLHQHKQKNTDRSNYAKVKTLKKDVALFNFLHSNGIASLADLHEKIAALQKEYYHLRGEIKTSEVKIKSLEKHFSMWEQYERYKPVHKELARIKPHKQADFAEAHRGELALFQAAARHFKELTDFGTMVTPKKWQADLKQEMILKNQLYQKMRDMREEIKTVEGIKKQAEQLEPRFIPPGKTEPTLD